MLTSFLNKLSFGLSSSHSEEIAQQILECAGKADGQRPFANTKNTRDTSKVPEVEGEKPQTEFSNRTPESDNLASRVEKVCGNVFAQGDAEVVLFLVNHQDPGYSRAILSHIESEKDISNRVLLIEDPEELTKWSGILPVVCWEEKETLTEVLKKKQAFRSLKERIGRLCDPEFSLQEKRLTIKQTVLNAKKLSLLSNVDDYCDQMDSLLMDLDHNQGRLKIEEGLLLEWLDKIYRVFVSQTIKKTMPARQSALIRCIDEHYKGFDAKPCKIYVICGASHGDLARSAFPKEVESLLNFLKQETRFYVCKPIIEPLCL
ncbi:MAG: hypothetical protein JJU12_05370 [Chlamydiales bacterium]|nr:hypothetical protein [Chlamydiales bacterium]